MQFNSGIFLKFFAAFLLLYWLARNSLRARNLLIVGASYLFYGWWDYRFLSLILASTFLDFYVGQALGVTHRESRRRALLWLSVGGNLGILGFFKYYDFFAASLAAACAQAGWSVHPTTLGILLPVGISFYTFQTMSYTIDVYRRDLRPTDDWLAFMAYVSFFPQLVAGPIERARHLLPQFAQPLRVTTAMLEEGGWLLLRGFFKKVVLADNLAPLTDLVYGAPNPTAPTVVLATVAFGFQIYCDFSGYSDIARGLARWLGFDLMVNFHHPYGAGSPREFWRRWHISLSTWLRDYLYVSLGGSRRGRARTACNLFLTMLLGGLWHGAAWNFILWGAYHGLGLILSRPFSPAVSPAPSSTHRLRLGAMAGWALTMIFIFYGWLLFRAGSWASIRTLTAALGVWSAPVWWPSFLVNLAAFTLPLLAVDHDTWLRPRAGQGVRPWFSWARAGLAAAMLLGIVLYWEKAGPAFIYFQF